MRLTLAILLALAFAVASWFLMSGLQVAEGPVDAPRTVLPEESHAPVPLPANADHTEADRVDATPGQEQVAEAAQDQRRSPDQSRVQSLLRKYGFESTDVPLAESQITELMTVSKTLDGEVVILGNRIGELSLPLRDKIFASKESLSVALQMGIVRRVEKMGDGAGPVRQPGAVDQIF
jgi:hypothetical protein